MKKLLLLGLLFGCADTVKTPPEVPPPVVVVPPNEPPSTVVVVVPPRLHLVMPDDMPVVAVPLVVVPELTSVCFVWDKNPETYVASYRFYHGTAPADYADVEDIADGTTEHCIENVIRGTLLYASVTAVSNGGQESPLSTELPFRGKYDLTKWAFKEKVIHEGQTVRYEFTTPRGAVDANFIEPMVSDNLVGFAVMAEKPIVTPQEDGTDLVTVTTETSGRAAMFFRLGFKEY